MKRAIYALVILLTALLSVGVLMLYSTSSIFAEQQYSDSLFFVKRQLMWIGVGLACLLATASFNYTTYRKYAWPLLAFGAVLLVLVLIPGVGRVVGGGRRWIPLGGLAFQPSEAVKLILLLFFADRMVRNREFRVTGLWDTFLFPFTILGFFLGLVFIEPDFGMTMLIGSMILLVFFVGGMPLRYLLTTILLSAPLAMTAVLSSSYRRRRILAFLNPWEDPRGIGFQIIQSFVALGSGGLLGVGLGQSQQKLFFLPEAHTDFIFAIIGEELGFLGCCAVVVLFLALICVCLHIAVQIEDDYGRLLVVGVVSMIGFQAALNIGVVTGALPTKGLPLPFISFGGSNLAANMTGMGIVLNVARLNGRSVEKEKIFRAKKTRMVRL